MEKEIVILGTELNQGDQFMANEEIHEIIGFLVSTNAGYMYSQVMNHPDGLRYVNKWVWKQYSLTGDNVYELINTSNYTVLDMVVQFESKHVESIGEMADRFNNLAKEFCPMEYQHSSRRVWANELRFQNRITPDEYKLLEVYYGNLWTYVGD